MNIHLATKDRIWWFAGWAAIALVLGLLAIRLFVLDFYRIPQNGMYPSLPAGSYVIANKLAYSGTDDVRRGDVVIFKHRQDGRDYIYIWRVVALPGETVEANGKSLIVNGSPAELEPLRDEDDAAIYREQLDGAGYEVAFSNAPRQMPPDASLVIPEGHFFLLGDNRFDAADSRYHGPIPFSEIIGKKL